jgi:E1-E2 ATPase
VNAFEQSNPASRGLSAAEAKRLLSDHDPNELTHCPNGCVSKSHLQPQRSGTANGPRCIGATLFRDVIRLGAGDLVPADARLLEAKHLHVNQASLTGESLPTEKEAVAIEPTPQEPLASRFGWLISRRLTTSMSNQSPGSSQIEGRLEPGLVAFYRCFGKWGSKRRIDKQTLVYCADARRMADDSKNSPLLRPRADRA